MAKGQLLLVIPPVVDTSRGRLLIDGDFANNLIAYLAAFDSVRVMCPATTTDLTFPTMVEPSAVPGSERLQVEVLPLPYREDRYFRNKARVSRQLKAAIAEADYLLISPHSLFDWSTLAARIARRMGRRYNMEADWNLPEVRADLWKELPFGPEKARRWFWNRIHDRDYFAALKHSSLSLLQGGDVFHDLGPHAPNAYLVLNAQVTDSDHVGEQDLADKLTRLAQPHVPHLFYAGRAADIKGPFHWLDVVTLLRDWGCTFRATWAGDGDKIDEMRRIVAERGLEDVVALPGKVDRAGTRKLMASSDLFLFCHLAKESPRCLVESLALGTPIVGFGTNYPRELVRECGGGQFVDRGEVEPLARIVKGLFDDPAALVDLTRAAAASGRLLDMDKAIAYRIGLIKSHLAR